MWVPMTAAICGGKEGERMLPPDEESYPVGTRGTCARLPRQMKMPRLQLQMHIYRPAFVGLLLGAFVFIRFYGVIKSFWLFDDPYLLHMAAANNPLDFFVGPSLWRLISVQSFTPMVMFSFWTDYALFGFHVQYFYVHQLVMLWLSSFVLYLLLLRYVDRKFSFLGALLFLGSAPAGAAAHMLMVRHYVEGLFFCLLAFLFFVESVRRKSRVLSLLGAGFFLCAAAAKEIYVPVGLLVLFLPEADFRSRFRHALPFLGVLLFYFLWRGAMLGSVGGGAAGAALTVAGLTEMAVRAPRDIIASVVMFSGGGRLALGVGICLGILYLLEAVSLIARGSYASLGFVAFLTLSVFPLPMLAGDLYLLTGDFPNYRLVFSVAVFFAVCAALAAGRLYDSGVSERIVPRIVRWTALVAIVLLFILTFAGSSRWLDSQKKALLDPLSMQGRFFIENGGRMVMVNAFPKYATTGYFENLEYLKGGPAEQGSPLVTAGMFAFPEKAQVAIFDRERVFAFDNSTGRMKDITTVYRKDRLAFLARVKELPLSVTFRVDRGVISYTLGPADGHYFGLFGYRSGTYPSFMELPRAFKARGATEKKSFYLRVGRETPEGLLTFSPEWFVDLSKDVRIEWRRE